MKFIIAYRDKEFGKQRSVVLSTPYLQDHTDALLAFRDEYDYNCAELLWIATPEEVERKKFKKEEHGKIINKVFTSRNYKPQ